jgi:hypothetical protein
MNLQLAPGLLVSILSALSSPVRADEPNTLTEEEKATGWRLLFDGRTTTGWRGYRSETMPASWKVENGSLLSRPGEGERRGDIITVKQYGDFELRLEWKMTRGNNSGVVYRATEEHANMWESGPEFQVLDNERHLDGLNRLASAGACYAVFAPAKDATRPVGEWNETRIIARGKHVEHWLNGEKVVEYEIDSDRWQAHVKTSKFFQTAYGRGNWGRAPKGHIGLQDYGGAIEFRSIKLRPLAKESADASAPRGARSFEALHALIKPGPGESRWMEIDWHPSVWEARRKAAVSGKPLFLMAGSGGAPASGC